MSYVAWSVVFGEQPTAAKWNILGDNDASCHDGTGIDDDVILTRHIDDGQVTALKLGMGIAFRGSPTSGQSIGATTYTKTNYATEEYDLGGNYDAANSKFTAPVNGIYNFSANIANTGTSVTGRTTLAVNGTQVRQSAFINTAGYYNIGLSADIKLTAGDYVEVYTYFVSAVTTSTSAASWFSGHFVCRV